MLVVKALLRGGIPFIIMGGIALMLYYQEKYTDAKGTFIASFIVFFVGAASVIYNIEHWSLLKQSIIHFLIMLVTIYPILLVSGWFPVTSVMDAFNIFILFFLVGVCLWGIMFGVMKVFS